MPDYRSPSEVAEQLFRAINEQRWADIPALVHPAELREFQQRELDSARGRQQAQKVMTAEDYLKHQPDLPRAVADYFAQQNAQQQTMFNGLRTDFGLDTIEELERLSPEQFLSTVMAARDERQSVQAFVVATHPEFLGEEFDIEPKQRSVIGEVVTGPVAYVIYRGEDQHQILFLRRNTTDWRVVPTGELFHSAMSIGFAHAEGEQPRQLQVTQTPWTSRKFEHQLEVGLFPSVLQRFRDAPLRVGQIASFNSVLRARPNGKWSVQEHLGHLIDLEELGERRLDDFIAKKDTLAAADMANRKTEAANHNERNWWELRQQFEEARGRLVARLEALPEDVIAHQALHPRLNRMMNVVDWMFFMCEHDDHHLTRMRSQTLELSNELMS